MSSTIQNFKDVVSDVKNNRFNGFKVSLDENRFDESFERFVEYGYLQGLNLADEVDSSNLNGFSEGLEGRSFDVMADGQKLFSTTLDKTFFSGGNSSKLKFEGLGSFRVEEAFPDISVPEGVKTVEDLATALDIRELFFRSSNFEGALPGPDKVKEKTSNMILGLILPVILGLTAFYYVVFR